jgi:hypothetical protein
LTVKLQIDRRGSGRKGRSVGTHIHQWAENLSLRIKSYLLIIILIWEQDNAICNVTTNWSRSRGWAAVSFGIRYEIRPTVPEMHKECHYIQERKSNIFRRRILKSRAVKRPNFREPVGHLPWVRSHICGIWNILQGTFDSNWWIKNMSNIEIICRDLCATDGLSWDFISGHLMHLHLLVRWQCKIFIDSQKFRCSEGSNSGHLRLDCYSPTSECDDATEPRSRRYSRTSHSDAESTNRDSVASTFASTERRWTFWIMRSCKPLKAIRQFSMISEGRMTSVRKSHRKIINTIKYVWFEGKFSHRSLSSPGTSHVLSLMPLDRRGVEHFKNRHSPRDANYRCT